MSTKSKLVQNNQTLNSNNQKLIAIKNAFLKPLPQYDGDIPSSGVDTSDATATQSDILLGKTAYVNDTKLIGTHVCPTTDNSIDTSDATAKASNIETGYDAYVDGVKLRGTNVMARYNSVFTVGTHDMRLIDDLRDNDQLDLYIDAPNKVIINASCDVSLAENGSIDNLSAENIKSGVSILGVTGTYEGGNTPTGTLNVTANGTYDVTNYASVNVNVSSSSGGGASLNAITTLPTANKYNVGCYCNVDDVIYKCVQASGINLLGYTDTLLGKTIKFDIESLRTDGKLYEGGSSTGTSNVYIDLVKANGSTYDSIRIDIELVTVNGVNQIKDIYYLYYPGNTSYKYHWYCYGKTSADNTTTNKYFDDNTITFTSDNVQIYNDCGYIKSTYQNNAWLEYLTIGDITYNWIAQ